MNLKKIFDLSLQSISTMHRSFAWTLPFLAFLAGYLCLHIFITDSSIQTPNLIGKDILQATKICSKLKLNLRIIAEKEINDAAPGTIITQHPLPQTLIKSHQSLFVDITKLQDPIIAPNLIGKTAEEIEKSCKDTKIKTRSYYVPSDYPNNQCFAQIPAANEILDGKKISYYVSTGNQTQFLFPDFINTNLEEVIQFLQEKNINFDVFYKDQKLTVPYNKNYVIAFQKPLAGTCINSLHNLYVQLQVQNR